MGTWWHCPAVPGKEESGSTVWQKSTSSKQLQGLVGTNMKVSKYTASGVPTGVTGG